MRGLFVVFEGPEGAGKTTQLTRLAEGLRTDGYNVVTTREPGGTPLGDKLRELLLGSDDYAMLAETEALLLSAARSQHVHEVIRPALERGAVVLCDRFSDSSIAYQGGGGGMSIEELRCLERIATRGMRPDLRLLLDVPIELGLARRHKDVESVNRIDGADRAFHQRIRETYLETAASDPGGWTVIDASRTPDQIFERVDHAVRQALAISLVSPNPERQA